MILAGDLVAARGGLAGGVAALRETAQGIHRELFEKQREMLERLEQASAAQTQQLRETVAAIRAEAVGAPLLAVAWRCGCGSEAASAGMVAA